MDNHTRITREELFMGMALLFARRSSCTKKQVGAVFVKDNRAISQGYNGVLPGAHPSTGIDDDGVTHTVHAEMNAIAYAAKKGIALDGFTAYLTLSPCEKCAEAMIQAGVKRVVYNEKYRSGVGIKLLLKHDVQAYEKT